jgi:hypothetical protein
MRKPSPAFNRIIFALLVTWCLWMSVLFFYHNPIAIVSLMPDLLILLIIIFAAFSIGSYALELLRVDALLPTEDFVVSTTLGLGALALLTILVSLLGFLNWWTISIGLIISILAGHNRIIGIANQPSYLFGPEDLAEEAPTPLSWTQYIVIAIWVVALFHFSLLPPVTEECLATTLGEPSQWLLTSTLEKGGSTAPSLVNVTTGLYALALALRGPHLAMMVSALVGGLTLAMLYSCAKRYCGPEAGRTTFLVASSLPVFSYLLLTPGNGLLVTLFQICAFFIMLRWFDERKRRWAVTSGFLLGLSLCVSPTSVFFVAPMMVAAYIWAIRQQKAAKFLRHLILAGGAFFLSILPWLAIHGYLFNNPLTLISPLLHLRITPLRELFDVMFAIPLQISFPPAWEAPWRTVGPLFIVFIPFYFFTLRKNPMTGLATALGIATLFFSKPFGIVMDDRFIAAMLLSVPAAMAAHRIADRGWRRTTAIVMLYIFIFGHIFFATAVMEDLLNSPHRFLLGLDTGEEYLEKTVSYYSAARRINEELPVDASILAFGQRGKLYINRKVIISEGELKNNTIIWLTTKNELDRGLSRLRNRGFTHLLINFNDLEQVQSPASSDERNTILHQIDRILSERKMFQAGDVAVYSLTYTHPS